MADNNHREMLKQMLNKHDTTMLVTHDIQGGLVSRPMTAQQLDDDGKVWFFVSSDADVIKEIEADAEVNVAYSIKDNYVSLSGNASIVEDEAKKKELWYPELKQWFNGEGPESSVVKLICVQTDTGRYWNISDGNTGKNRDNGSPIESGIVRY